jgi:ribosomal protein S18 acetylase RimI-like enzyme
MHGPIRILPFQPELAQAFAELNYHWIAADYDVEEHDREVLDHPRRSIIEKGGEIFFAVDGDRAVGTVAMIPYGPDEFELAKMAVSPEHRGRGIGDLLMEACITFARGRNAERIVLESNTKQVAALALYRKHGFVETPLDPNSLFRRANVRMMLAIEPA